MSDATITVLLYCDHPDVLPQQRGLRPRREPERDELGHVDPRFEEIVGTATALLSRFLPILHLERLGVLHGEADSLQARVAREVLWEIRALGHEVDEWLLPTEPLHGERR